MSVPRETSDGPPLWLVTVSVAVLLLAAFTIGHHLAWAILS